MARLRVEKVQEAIKNEISKMLLRDVKDPRIQFVSVTGVELTDDMSYAKIFVSLYGPEEKQEEAWKALQKALGFLRTEIAKRIRLRFAPALVLEKDTSLEYGAHIQSILDKINKEDKKNAPQEISQEDDEQEDNAACAGKAGQDEQGN